MGRGAKPAKAKVEARPSVATNLRQVDGSAGQESEQRLAEALEQQAATSEILRVISSSRTDVQPVFDVIAQSAARLCAAEFCHVFRYDGKLLHLGAFQGLSSEGVAALRRAYPMAPGRGSAAARSIVSGAVEHIPDVHADADYAHGAFAKVMTFRSIVAVPMLRDGVPIGAIAVARPQTGFFPDRQIQNALTLVRERAQRRGITLGRAIDERLGMIRADERKVKQVLLNLLSNALKFTPERGTIDVLADVNGGEAKISVRDTGVGIAPEDQKAVFEEFRQVGMASKKVEGTGLGLAISRKFIELHGGRIWVESQVGTGSTFAFTLPLTIDQPHTDLPARAAASQPRQ